MNLSRITAGFLSLAVAIIPLTGSGAFAGDATVNAADYRSSGSHTSGIQEAVYALGEGGGTVLIPAGVYEIDRAIHLGTGVQLKGEGEHTVIARRDEPVQVKITQPALTGGTSVTVADASVFRVGQEVTVRSDDSHGWWCAHAYITSIDGNTVQLDRELVHDYKPDENASLNNFFPALYAIEKKLIRIEDLAIDGRLGENRDFENDFTVSAIHTRDVSDSYIARVHITGWPGDGVSIQTGDNVTVTECTSEHNLGHGFHPGTGIASGSWTNNVGRFNGWDGLYFCHRVRHTTVSGNRFHDNGWNGIGGLGVGGDGGDRYNVISENFCYNNARCGIEATNGGNNIVVNNVCENNSRSEAGRYPGILVEDTHSSVISGNRCLDFQDPAEDKTQGWGILVVGDSHGNVILGNILSGHIHGGVGGEALDRNVVADNITHDEHVPAGK
ncbi:MAG: right-handed parallel beta-helix repeat-containing protein [Candidatus Glassbacteria bacterium]|nr:right-handed parallel beta-helix repeat-containing protein [Candidatus Glassbacteria bacterium]